MEKLEDEFSIDEVVNEDVDERHEAIKCKPQVKENVDVDSSTKDMRDEDIDIRNHEGILRLYNNNNIK